MARNPRAKSFLCKVLGIHSLEFIGHWDEIIPGRPGWEYGEPPFLRAQTHQCTRCEGFRVRLRNSLAGSTHTQWLHLEDQPPELQHAIKTFMSGDREYAKNYRKTDKKTDKVGFWMPLKEAEA